MSPVPQIAGEHHQIHRAPILLERREVSVPLVFGDAVAKRCLTSRALTLGTVGSPPMEIREVNDPNSPTHRPILHGHHGALASERLQHRFADGTSRYEIGPAFFHPWRKSHVLG
jgi:hypothetical protein